MGMLGWYYALALPMLDAIVDSCSCEVFMVTNTEPVALISMPTLSGRFPSFQLALLKSLLEKEGIPAQPFSLFMYFGTHIGWQINEAIADVWPSLVGEWVWSKTAFGDEFQTNDEEYFTIYDRIFNAICGQAGCSIDQIKRIRDKSAKSFIDF